MACSLPSMRARGAIFGAWRSGDSCRPASGATGRRGRGGGGGGLTGEVLTGFLVAGGRFFVRAADRSVAAYDAATGRRLWVLQRPDEPLVLRQDRLILALAT